MNRKNITQSSEKGAKYHTLYDSIKKIIYLAFLGLSCVLFFMTPRTVALQSPLSMDFPGITAVVGFNFLLQEIFPAQG